MIEVSYAKEGLADWIYNKADRFKVGTSGYRYCNQNSFSSFPVLHCVLLTR
jgi:hypothetical protein